MTVEEFVDRYERALGTQQWAAVEPLIHQDATVTFSTGAAYFGREQVRTAFERNFSMIEGEEYRIADVYWVLRSADTAVYTFGFEWAGVIDGQAASGSGRGTCVLVRNGDAWQLLAEHLGPAPR